MKKIRILLDTLTQLQTFVGICSKQPYSVFITDGTKEFRVSAKSTLGCIMAQMEWEEVYCEYAEEHGDELERLLEKENLVMF